MVGAMMSPVLKDGKDPKVVATEWVKANGDTINTWLEGVTAMDGSDAKAAVAKVMQ